MGDMARTAEISRDGQYRYRLTRMWNPDEAMATFIMLNPSTANATADDPTIRRCIGFARSWGLGGIVVANLYALRSTDPSGLWAASDPVGPYNDAWLAGVALDAAESDAPLIAAWGANAKRERINAVLGIPHMDRLQALGVTKAGQPRHPLYLSGSAQPASWPEAS